MALGVSLGSQTLVGCTKNFNQKAAASSPAMSHHRGKQSMPFVELNDTSSELMEPAAKSIRTKKTRLDKLPKASLISNTGIVKRPYIDEGATSRTPLRAPSGPWKIAQSITLDASVQPESVLVANQRVLVVASDRVVLFSDAGKKLMQAARGAGAPPPRGPPRRTGSRPAGAPRPARHGGAERPAPQRGSEPAARPRRGPG